MATMCLSCTLPLHDGTVFCPDCGALVSSTGTTERLDQPTGAKITIEHINVVYQIFEQIGGHHAIPVALHPPRASGTIYLPNNSTMAFSVLLVGTGASLFEQLEKWVDEQVKEQMRNV